MEDKDPSSEPRLTLRQAEDIENIQTNTSVTQKLKSAPTYDSQQIYPSPTQGIAGMLKEQQSQSDTTASKTADATNSHVDSSPTIPKLNLFKKIAVLFPWLGSKDIYGSIAERPGKMSLHIALNALSGIMLYLSLFRFSSLVLFLFGLILFLINNSWSAFDRGKMDREIIDRWHDTNANDVDQSSSDPQVQKEIEGQNGRKRIIYKIIEKKYNFAPVGAILFAIFSTIISSYMIAYPMIRSISTGESAFNTQSENSGLGVIFGIFIFMIIDCSVMSSASALGFRITKLRWIVIVSLCLDAISAVLVLYFSSLFYLH